MLALRVHAEHFEPLSAAVRIRRICDSFALVEHSLRVFGGPGFLVSPGGIGVIHLGVMNPSMEPDLCLSSSVETSELALLPLPSSGALERLGYS